VTGRRDVGRVDHLLENRCAAFASRCGEMKDVDDLPEKWSMAR
jgi:hypothetical protein